jgi:hypothetical protein
MGFYSAIRNGDLRFSLILTVPRTVSTALTRALAQSPDIDAFFIQPFSRLKQNRLERLNREVDKLLLGHRRNKPAHIIIKEMCDDISERQFSLLAKNMDKAIILCRDPQLQVFSHIKILADSPCNQVTHKNLPHQKLSQYMLSHYFRPDWKTLEARTDFLRERSNIDYKIIEGDMVRAMPEWSLRKISSFLGIRYSEKMVGGWKPPKPEEKRHINDFGNAYTGRALRTEKFHKPDTPTPSISSYPENMRHMIASGMASYAKLMADDRALIPSLAKTFDLARTRVSGVRQFADNCPIATYCLLKHFEYATSNPQAHEAILGLREAHRDMQHVFEIIDNINENYADLRAA